MLMPSIFGENLFDDWFNDFPFYSDKEMKDVEKKLYGKKAGRIMKTDVKEHDDSYELIIDIPGFSKDEIKASLDNGYLTISAAKGYDKSWESFPLCCGNPCPGPASQLTLAALRQSLSQVGFEITTEAPAWNG